jgi:hypothetical protein
MVGFLVGVAAAAVVVAIIFVVRRHNEVAVSNDTHTWVRIAGCVDGESQDINSGDSFVAEGVPSRGVLYCLVTPEAIGQSRCMAVRVRKKHPHLTQLPVVAPARCD